MINTHGIKGEAKIYSYSDFDDERYAKGNTVWMKHGDEMIPLTVKTYRVHKGFPLVSFEELKDINAVEPYRNCELFITDDMREEFDYILIDCPAGIEQGFKNAIAGATRA